MTAKQQKSPVTVGQTLKATLVTAGRTLKGGNRYRIWVSFLAVLIIAGLVAYFRQLHVGLITTAMRDQVSWGFYISNFIFLVGVAAAAVLLVVPAYLYDFKPIREIVLFGEMAAIVAVAMCLIFITVDLGQPLRVWHLLPLVGKMNFPASLLIWDVIALSGYLAINLVLVGYALYRYAIGKEYRLNVILPLILLSIPWAVSIHTVTAFIFNGLSSRPFWNASILAPRFLASAFCSGPAIMIILFEIMRKYAGLKIEERALSKIAELVAYTIGINLFLLGVEIFKEFYSGSIHLTPLEYLYFGLHGHARLVPWAWLALLFNISAFVIFLSPELRRKAPTRSVGAVLIIAGVYIEKGMGLVVPGFIPDALGEIYQYWPTWSEVIITVGIWATGALLYTVMAKFALAALPNAVSAQDR